MGLSITAYRKITLVAEENDQEVYEEKYDWMRTAWIYPAYILEPQFSERVSGLVPGGAYRYKGEYRFEAGSYSGYNEWRDKLSLLMLGVPASTVWEDREFFKDKPFYYLIDFSDCEGIISGEAAQKLYQDFLDNQEKADSHPEEWWRDLYEDWRIAFEFAADNGFVDFH